MKQNDKSLGHSLYLKTIYEYIKYKELQGYKMAGTFDALCRFNKFAISTGETKIGISKELMDKWCRKFPSETECNRYQRISKVRNFSAYLQLMGYDSYIPKLPKYISTYIPHIFTKEEMVRIFSECDKMRVFGNYPRSVKNMIPALIRVLYGTGIRISEALNLTHSDVDLNDGFLHLRKCKNNNDRIVPLSMSVRDVCKDYLMYKQNIGLAINPDKPFFTSAKGERCTTRSIYTIFRIVLYRAGIPHQGRGKGPRIHDLRHTFCVNALVKLSESGLDLYYSLPILMTYMGHRSINATNKYVRLTEELYPDLIKKVDEVYQYVFPNLYSNINCEYEND